MDSLGQGYSEDPIGCIIDQAPAKAPMIISDSLAEYIEAQFSIHLDDWSIRYDLRPNPYPLSRTIACLNQPCLLMLMHCF